MPNKLSDPFDDAAEDSADVISMPRQRRRNEEMDITPMIDITFLLLIFFVVCSKMDPTQTGKIPTAENALAISAKDSAVIFLEPAGDQKVILKRLDQSRFSEDEETMTNEIVEYITAELEKTISKDKNQVMLLGHPDTEVHHVTRVRQIIGDAFEDMEFTYIAVKEN